jgi:hypothetical protein
MVSQNADEPLGRYLFSTQMIYHVIYIYLVVGLGWLLIRIVAVGALLWMSIYGIQHATVKNQLIPPIRWSRSSRFAPPLFLDKPPSLVINLALLNLF